MQRASRVLSWGQRSGEGEGHVFDPVLLELDVLDGESVVGVADMDVVIGRLQDAGVAVLGDWEGVVGLQVSREGPRLSPVLGERDAEGNAGTGGRVVHQHNMAVVEHR